ncbi:acetylcholinesterase, putative [Ixodes scapularis]|uniref:Carboxylic ester hydrolase n=1 Tax=Ixodes scapularis TaxID=6945 RepID=B7PWE5_IXOSC|nr:acetylcholinesterase, putative [Ixodes scapularis]|eukprot:XP_002409707.1 acetylcholinesterase, putative [Ixodes scapularis]
MNVLMPQVCRTAQFRNVLQVFILYVMVYFADSTKPVAGDVPIVRTDLGLVAGERITIGDRMVDAFLGIPYAKPPVGDLRFKKPHPVAAWNGTYNATRKPTPCWQQNVRFRDAETDYSDSSEDCLYLNIWRRSFYCENNYNSCGKKRPVVVFIQGGAFQWGDSGLFVYDAANFVSLTDAIYVTFNYRLGIFGFLSLETPELPGNMGLWDQNLVLKWVKKNIEHFGGDPDDVTINGQSAGGISAGMHAVSPHSKGLFKRIIMESGTPLSIILGISYKGAGKFTSVTSALGCYDFKRSFEAQTRDVIDCLKKLDAAFVYKILKSLDLAQQIFVPVHGDDFLPHHPLMEQTWKHLEFKELLLGTNLNEGTLFFDNLQYTFPALKHLLTGDYRLAVTVALGPAFDIPVSQAREIVRYYFGDYDVEHNSRSVGDIFSRIFGDAVFNCPTQLFADLAAEQGISTYRYMFAHRPSFSVWPEWMGVVHADELAFTLGSLPFAKDETRHTKQLGAHLRRLLLNTTYTAEEETFMRRLVSTWNSFVRNGKPVIPVPGIDWPLYKAESSKLLYLRPGNYTVARDSSRDICELWRPFLLKKMKSTASLQTPSPSKTVNKMYTQMPDITNRLTPQENTLNSSALRELHLSLLVLTTLYFIVSNFR